MVVLIAPEIDITNEIEILTQLFQEGLQFYHLRKPNKDYKGYCHYLDQIDTKYHSRIVVHYFHELLGEYTLKGIHFQEAKRKETSLETLKSISPKKQITLSSSFHTPKDIERCEFEFDYHLLSPVFTSISKRGYEGKGFDVNHINKRIVGMGGVTPENLAEFDKLGYTGVGVLGGIWNSKSPITNFKKMQNYFTKTRSYI